MYVQNIYWNTDVYVHFPQERRVEGVSGFGRAEMGLTRHASEARKGPELDPLAGICSIPLRAIFRSGGDRYGRASAVLSSEAPI
jgi:hypothetical protein